MCSGLKCAPEWKGRNRIQDALHASQLALAIASNIPAPRVSDDSKDRSMHHCGLSHQPMLQSSVQTAGLISKADSSAYMYRDMLPRQKWDHLDITLAMHGWVGCPSFKHTPFPSLDTGYCANALQLLFVSMYSTLTQNSSLKATAAHSSFKRHSASPRLVLGANDQNEWMRMRELLKVSTCRSVVIGK